jgi:hypothetical protein
MVEAISRVHEIDRAACRQRVEANFTAEIMAARYEAVYQRLLAIQGGAPLQRDVSFDPAVHLDRVLDPMKDAPCAPRGTALRGEMAPAANAITTDPSPDAALP